MADDYKPVTLVYCGERLGRDNKRFVAYQIAGGEPGWYPWSAKYARRAIGGMYSGATHDGKMLRGLNIVRYEGRIKDTGQIATWEAEDLAAKTTLEEDKLHKQDRRISEIERLLLPLRKEYAKHIGEQYDRAKAFALQNAVLAALHTPPRQSEL